VTAERILCRTPTPGRKPTVVEFGDLARMVERELGDDERVPGVKPHRLRRPA